MHLVDKSWRNLRLLLKTHLVKQTRHPGLQYINNQMWLENPFVSDAFDVRHEYPRQQSRKNCHLLIQFLYTAALQDSFCPTSLDIVFFWCLRVPWCSSNSRVHDGGGWVWIDKVETAIRLVVCCAGWSPFALAIANRQSDQVHSRLDAFRAVSALAQNYFSPISDKYFWRLS